VITFAPACAAQSNRPALVPDNATLLSAIASVVAKQETYPKDAKAQVEVTAGGPGEIAIGGERRILVPVYIHFQGVDNSYCRLAVFDPAKSSAELIPLPTDADHDHCQGMRRIAVVDLNHDGITDFVYQVTIPSNRYAATVTEGAVYLSKPSAKTYCYSAAASRVVTSDVPPQTAMVRKAIDAEVARLGPKVFDCAGLK
jgi:hypothetical protein